MKKVLSIALAVLIGLTAVASFAIVPRDADPTGKRLSFVGINISTAYALATYTLPGVSSIADAGKSFVGNEVIFCIAEFAFDSNKPDTHSAIDIHLTSENATFPLYLNTAYNGGEATAHFLDKNGVLQILSRARGRDINPFDLDQVTGDEEFIIRVRPGTGTSYENMFEYFTNDWNNSGFPTPIAKKGDGYATTLYVGFNGVVKNSTALTGVIKAYITASAASFPTSFSSSGNWQYVGPEMGLNHAEGGATYDNYAPFIDVYDEAGALKYRVYALFYGGFYINQANKYAWEYLVQPYVNKDKLASWAVGYANTATSASNKVFDKVTYREGLPTTKASWVDDAKFGDWAAKGFPIGNVSSHPDDNKGKTADPYCDLARTNYAGKTATADGYYYFFKVEEWANKALYIGDAEYELDSKILPIMSWFGFSFGYYNATRHSDYENKAGWKDYKEATFKYFGAEVPIDDEDVIPAETGDASASIVIILGASAILAAAALFFVMKKARG